MEDRLGILIKSSVANKPAANKIGIDIRKENRAAVGRSKSLLIAPVIVAPDRDIPGKRAKI